jgi:hypothetical protein
MRLYEGTVADFNQAVLQNEIADRIAFSYERYYLRRVGQPEYRAWQQSFNFLRNSFEQTGLTDNTLIIEYEQPYSTRRIDVLLFGRDQHAKVCGLRVCSSSSIASEMSNLTPWTCSFVTKLIA